MHGTIWAKSISVTRVDVCVCVAFWFPAGAVFLCATFALFTMPEALAYFDFSQHCHIFLHAGWRRRKEGGDK